MLLKQAIALFIALTTAATTDDRSQNDSLHTIPNTAPSSALSSKLNLTLHPAFARGRTTYTTTTITITECNSLICSSIQRSCTTRPQPSHVDCGKNRPQCRDGSVTAVTSPTSPLSTTTTSKAGVSGATTSGEALTGSEQCGESTWGTLGQETFPKWLGDNMAEPPWGNRTVQTYDATIKGDIPKTGVTRRYTFTISRSRLSPDGVLRDVIVVNGQYPGPIIEANWGDWIEVVVHNSIADPEEGTALHWHGMPQRHSQWEDGTPGISQCPIAPGHSYTYKFRAEVFGSSFWHAHYSAQYTAGVVGPMQIYGPYQQDYDFDLGPVMLSDWNHIPYFSMVSDVVGSDLSKIPPFSDDGLINGRGRFDCARPSYSNSSEWLGSNLKSNLSWTCVDGAERAQFLFKSGKKHRLRLMNTGADGVGQRTDIVVTANGAPRDSYWMRTHLPGGPFCGGLGEPTGPGSTYPQVLGIIRYEDADISLEPSSSPLEDVNNNSCDNDSLNMTQPEFAVRPNANPFYRSVALSLVLNSTGSWEWRMNDQTYRADFNEPLLYKAANGNVNYPHSPQWNVYNFHENNSIVLNVSNETPFWHPFHLHGHTFFVLSVGPAGTIWNGSIVNPFNPMRRDVQIVPAGGYAAIQFEADNPGVWPFHCHAAWHLSGGLSMNVMTKPDKIGLIPKGTRESTCKEWDAYSNRKVVDQIDSGS